MSAPSPTFAPSPAHPAPAHPPVCQTCISGEGHQTIAALKKVHGIPKERKVKFNECDYCEEDRYFAFKAFKDLHEDSVHDEEAREEQRMKKKAKERRIKKNLERSMRKKEQSIKAQKEKEARKKEKEAQKKEEASAGKDLSQEKDVSGEKEAREAKEEASRKKEPSGKMATRETSVREQLYQASQIQARSVTQRRPKPAATLNPGVVDRAGNIAIPPAWMVQQTSSTVAYYPAIVSPPDSPKSPPRQTTQQSIPIKEASGKMLMRKTSVRAQPYQASQIMARAVAQRRPHPKPVALVAPGAVYGTGNAAMPPPQVGQQVSPTTSYRPALPPLQIPQQVSPTRAPAAQGMMNGAGRGAMPPPPRVGQQIRPTQSHFCPQYSSSGSPGGHFNTNPAPLMLNVGLPPGTYPVKQRPVDGTSIPRVGGLSKRVPATSIPPPLNLSVPVLPVSQALSVENRWLSSQGSEIPAITNDSNDIGQAIWDAIRQVPDATLGFDNEPEMAAITFNFDNIDQAALDDLLGQAPDFGTGLLPDFPFFQVSQDTPLQDTPIPGTGTFAEMPAVSNHGDGTDQTARDINGQVAIASPGLNPSVPSLPESQGTPEEVAPLPMPEDLMEMAAEAGKNGTMPLEGLDKLLEEQFLNIPSNGCAL